MPPKPGALVTEFDTENDPQVYQVSEQELDLRVSGDDATSQINRFVNQIALGLVCSFFRDQTTLSAGAAGFLILNQ